MKKTKTDQMETDMKDSRNRERMVVSSFSIPREEKEKYQELFQAMGLNQWANGMRFALAEFYKQNAAKYLGKEEENDKSDG